MPVPNSDYIKYLMSSEQLREMDLSYRDFFAAIPPGEYKITYDPYTNSLKNIEPAEVEPMASILSASDMVEIKRMILRLYSEKKLDRPEEMEDFVARVGQIYTMAMRRQQALDEAESGQAGSKPKKDLRPLVDRLNEKIREKMK